MNCREIHKVLPGWASKERGSQHLALRVCDGCGRLQSLRSIRLIFSLVLSVRLFVAAISPLLQQVRADTTPSGGDRRRRREDGVRRRRRRRRWPNGANAQATDEATRTGEARRATRWRRVGGVSKVEARGSGRLVGSRGRRVAGHRGRSHMTARWRHRRTTDRCSRRRRRTVRRRTRVRRRVDIRARRRPIRSSCHGSLDLLGRRSFGGVDASLCTLSGRELRRRAARASSAESEGGGTMVRLRREWSGSGWRRRRSTSSSRWRALRHSANRRRGRLRAHVGARCRRSIPHRRR